MTANPSPQRAILSVENLSITFGDLKALRNVSLTIARGEKVALLGHNGAGKSTLFKSILGFITPAGGSISVAGGAPGSTQARLAVSYLPEAVAFPRMLTGAEVITYFARLKSVDPIEALPLLERVGLDAARNRRVGDYSKGMRQRLGLAQALIGSPDLLLLDEPTSGLDPVSRREFYEIIDRAAASGTAILFSSHALSEVEGHMDRIAILSRGRLVAEGDLKALAEAASLPVSIRLIAHEGEADALHARYGGQRVNGRSVVLSCEARDKLALLGRIAADQAGVDDIDITLPGLDDIYRFYSMASETGDTP